MTLPHHLGEERLHLCGVAKINPIAVGEEDEIERSIVFNRLKVLLPDVALCLAASDEPVKHLRIVAVG
jgi:hypothetical protein